MSTKEPQDHKKKNFSFEYEGKTYTFEKRLTGGLIRKNRNLSEFELQWVVLEEIAGEEALGVLDDMDIAELNDLMKDLFGGNTAGE